MNNLSRQQEECFRILAESLGDCAVFLLDRHGCVATWNDGARRVLGYPDEEILGQHLHRFYAPEDARDSRTRYALQAAEAVRYEEEGWRARRDGSRFWASMVLVPLRDDRGRLQGFGVVLRDLTELRFARRLTDQLGEGVCAVDRQGRVTFLNAAAEQMLGWTQAVAEQLRLHDTVHYQHEDGTPYPASECPLIGVLETGRTFRALEDVFIRKDGTRFPVGYSSSPMRAGGELVGAVVAFRDITERKQAEEALRNSREQLREQAVRLGILADASRAFSEARLDWAALVNAVCERVSNLIGETCVISLRSQESGWLDPVAVHDPDPETRRAVLELLTSSPVQLGEGLMGRVAQSGEPLLINRMTHDQVRPLVKPEYRHSLSPAGMYSALVVPLRVRGQVIGTLGVYRDEPGTPYTAADQTLLQELADRAAISIDNARLHQEAVEAREETEQALQRERRIAERLQECLRPHLPHCLPGYRLSHAYQPALAEASLGGAFYDVFSLGPNRYGVLIGDVAGKGLEAAAHSVMARYALRGYAAEYEDPVQVVRLLNEAVLRETAGTDTFVTLFYGVLDTSTHRLTYVTAGHERPLLLPAGSSSPVALETTGPIIGAVSELFWEQRTLVLPPGASLLLYTDGATEARRDDTFLGVTGLAERLVRVRAHTSGQDLVDRLLDIVETFAGGYLRDDIAFLLLQRKLRE